MIKFNHGYATGGGWSYGVGDRGRSMVAEATKIVASTTVAMEVGDTVATSRGIGKAVERSALSDVHRQHAAGVANDWSRWGSKCNWSG